MGRDLGMLAKSLATQNQHVGSTRTRSTLGKAASCGYSIGQQGPSTIKIVGSQAPGIFRSGTHMWLQCFRRSRGGHERRIFSVRAESHRVLASKSEKGRLY